MVKHKSQHLLAPGIVILHGSFRQKGAAASDAGPVLTHRGELLSQGVKERRRCTVLIDRSGTRNNTLLKIKIK